MIAQHFESQGRWIGRLVVFAVIAAGLMALASPASARPLTAGAVYTITDSPGGNEVLAFQRGSEGLLTEAGAFATGGAGTGGALGSQGAVALSENGRYVVAVNGGSDSVSILAVRPGGLELIDVEPSQGDMPVSVTIDGDIAYVVNNGSDSIAGFRISQSGLTPIAGSVQALPAGSEPGQISFTPSGDTLVVSVKNLDVLVGFAVDPTGAAGAGVSAPTAAPTPFGFAIDRFDHAIVSEAPGSDLSSYQVAGDGSISLIDGPVANGQIAACWVVLSKDGRFAFSANAGSANISSYSVGRDGSLDLVNAVAGGTIGGPLDLAISNDGHYLYAVSRAASTISVFEFEGGGSLTFIGSVSDVAMGSASGLVAK